MKDFNIDFIEEPKLQFGAYFEHEDSKTGLAEFGPFGKNIIGLHPSEITLGFIGTRESVSGVKEWVDECAFPIESENRRTIEPKYDAGKQPSGPSLFGAGIFEDESPRMENEPFIRLMKILNRDFVGFSLDSPFQCCFQMNDRWDRSSGFPLSMLLPDERPMGSFSPTLGD